MRQRTGLASRGERVLLALLSVLVLSGLALYAWAPRATSPLSEAEPPRVVSASDSLYKDKHYVGPPQGIQDPSMKKLTRGMHLDLNTADSLALLRVPGIGPAFAHRILSLRQRLGGYYTILQLQEVYGMDEDRFLALRPWFVLQTPPRCYPLNSLDADSVPWHPYLTRELAGSLRRLLRRHGAKLSWTILRTQGGFSQDDSIRLSPYFTDKLVPRSSSDTIIQPS